MYRKGVSALIMNEKQQLLLVNLKSFKKIYYAVPGGGLEVGESLKQAVYREIEEELGIAKKHLKLIGKSKKPIRFKFKEIKLNRDGVKYTGTERLFFGLRFLGKQKDIVPKDGELRSYKWVSYKDLNKYLLFDNQLEETVDKISELFSITQ
jgi:ADP-ribose pyrophosphatase YjhB (NUDIX family)